MMTSTIQSSKFVFILANSADLDEMLHCAAFHLGQHCLTKYIKSYSAYKELQQKKPTKGAKPFFFGVLWPFSEADPFSLFSLDESSPPESLLD